MNRKTYVVDQDLEDAVISKQIQPSFFLVDLVNPIGCFRSDIRIPDLWFNGALSLWDGLGGVRHHFTAPGSG
jgi:hypothetical protein